MHVREDQLSVDRLHVVLRIHLALDVHDVRIGENADNLTDRVTLADVSQELVAKARAFARTLDDAGNIDERNRGWELPFRGEDAGQNRQTRVRHADYTNIGLYRRERIISRENVIFRQRVKKRGLTNVRKTDDSDGQCHCAHLFSQDSCAGLRRPTPRLPTAIASRRKLLLIPSFDGAARRSQDSD